MLIYGPVYTERQCQCCNVSSDIALIKLLDILMNEVSCSKNGLRPQLIRYNASVDTDAPNQSFLLNVNGP